jgi:predicted N-acetyltransferase YhbS
MGVSIREFVAGDSRECARIVYEAFDEIARRHGFPRDFPSPELAEMFMAMAVHDERYWGVVAEQDGRVVGSNFVSEWDEIRGVGPISVDPAAQGMGAGRRLMDAGLERSRGAAGVRLVQDAFNGRSMSLYASLGFDIKEPLVLIGGTPSATTNPAIAVRRMVSDDVAACADLHRRVHGVDRAVEIGGAVAQLSPWVATRNRRIVAYATSPSMWHRNHGVAEREEDMQAVLVAAAATEGRPLSFLLPTRQAELFRWCLRAGLRVVKPMTLMALGRYHEPAGCHLPSVHY